MSAAGRIRVRCVYPFTPDDRAMLEAVSDRLEWVFEGEDSQAWVDALVDPALEILVASTVPRDAQGTPRLRWCATAAAGVEDLVRLDPWSRGITVTNGSGIHAVHMAEYLLAGVLTATERIEARFANHAARGWGGATSGLNGRRLRGRHAVIVGYGSIGRETARVLAALGVRITAVKRDPAVRHDDGWREPGTGDPDGTIPSRWAAPHELADAVRDADFVLLTAPATAATRHLVSAHVLAAMRPDAWLLNVGRGSVVDQAALAVALRHERLGGAILDVTVPEPLPPDDPLWDAPRCLVTPHISAIGDRAYLWHLTAVLLAEQLRRDLAGEPQRNVVSPTAGY